jgi:hypothetical protein
MSTTTLFGSTEAQAARDLIGGTAIGDLRNDLLKQILVATANRTGGSGGSGTVTSVSVTTQNGVSATVTNPTTTPALAFTLGAITPTTVQLSGSVSGTTLLQSPAIAGSAVITFPSVTGTLAITGNTVSQFAAGGTISSLTGFSLRDTSAAFDATLGFTSSTALTQARALTFDLVNGSRTFKMAGNVDLGGAFTTTGSGTIALGGFTLTVPATGTAALLGIANTFTAAQTINAGTLSTAAFSASQTWNNAGVTCRGIEFAVTNTNSASGSTLLRILGGAAGATQALALSALHGSLTVGSSSNSATIMLQGSDRFATASLGTFGSEFMFSSTQLAANNVALRFTDANTVVRYGTIYGETTDVLALRNGSAGTTGAAWEMLEMTAPGTPSADRLRLYVEDNGSGKTRLVVKFSDGSTAVLATQP